MGKVKVENTYQNTTKKRIMMETGLNYETTFRNSSQERHALVLAQMFC